jgi:hypothetical protein
MNNVFQIYSLCCFCFFETGYQYIIQAGLELDLPASTSQVLGLQVYATMPILYCTFGSKIIVGKLQLFTEHLF